MNCARLWGMVVAAAGAAAVASACSESKSTTGIVVEVTSDLSVPAELDQVRISATGSDGSELFQQAFPLAGASARALPVRVGLMRQNDAAVPFRVVAEGLLGGTVRVARSAKLAFIAGKVVLLRLPLDSACSGRTCPAEQTCSAGACISDTVDPGSLPPYTPRDDGGAGGAGGSGGGNGGAGGGVATDGGADRPATDTAMPPTDAPADLPGVDTSVDRGGGDRGDGGPPPTDAGTDASVDLNVGLVAYWAFDQAALTFPDYSGNGNTMRTFSATMGWTSMGQVGGAANLTPIGAGMSIGETPSVTSIATAVTFATWIRPTGAFGAKHTVLTRQIALNNTELAVDFVEQGMLRFLVGPRIMQTAVVVGNVEQWIHIATTYDGDRGVIYVNGQQSIANTLGAVSLGSFNTGMLFGSRVDINYLPYDDLAGQLDEFVIYNRALNAAEVAALASGALPTRR